MQRGATSYRGRRSLAAPGRIGAHFTPRPQLFRVQLRVHDLHRRTIAHFAGTGRLLIFFCDIFFHDAAMERARSNAGNRTSGPWSARAQRDRDIFALLLS